MCFDVQVKDEYLMINFSFENKNSSLQYTVATHNLELYYNCISYRPNINQYFL